MQYMSVGVPVVASAIGMNHQIIQDNVNGFLIKDTAGWVAILKELVSGNKFKTEGNLSITSLNEDSEKSLKSNPPSEPCKIVSTSPTLPLQTTGMPKAINSPNLVGELAFFE